jgi:DNA segregation ATPase FtsK/SpoIIIE-like protein
MEYLPMLSLFARLFIGYRIEKLHNLLAEWKADWDDAKGTPADWQGILGEPDEEDELYRKAKEILIKARKASTSFLQRKLGTGYSRASRLLDRLEEEGVIGPADLQTSVRSLNEVEVGA